VGIDEASFYEERLAYVVEQASRTRGLTFIFPSLVLNFRREIFTPRRRCSWTPRRTSFPHRYCEHPECLQDSFYNLSLLHVEGRECPALYFDPLLVIGGDREVNDPREPNYCTRCDDTTTCGQEYTFLN